MANVFISTGSNSGDRIQHLQTAVERLAEVGIVIAKSSVYETEPWGFHSPTAFLNQVIQLETSHEPEKLLDVLFEIENKSGRQRTYKGYASRTLDIDILMYDDLIMESTLLSLPHPHLHERLFVLQPFAEIAPLLIHPVLQKSIIILLEECGDDSWIELYQG